LLPGCRQGDDRRRSGSIVNLSSQVGLTPGAGGGAYPISKAGIIMLTRQLALELAEHRIRVNAIAPGIVKTDFNAAFWKTHRWKSRPQPWFRWVDWPNGGRRSIRRFPGV